MSVRMTMIREDVLQELRRELDATKKVNEALWVDDAKKSAEIKSLRSTLDANTEIMDGMEEFIRLRPEQAAATIVIHQAMNSHVTLVGGEILED